MEKKKIKIRDNKALALNILSGCFGFVILLMVLSFIFRIVSPRQLQSKATNSMVITAPVQPLQINILNACGVDGIAKNVKGYLNNNKFVVVNVGNSTSIAEKSYIKCNFTDSKVLELANELGIDAGLIKSLNNSTNQEISVVIGSDYSVLKPFKRK